MSKDTVIKIVGLEELERAIKRNPKKAKAEVDKALQRVMAIYRRHIGQSAPWTVGAASGGVPKNTGKLRQSHRVEFKPWEAKMKVGDSTGVPYAVYVHEGTKNMKKRPWLDVMMTKRKKEVSDISVKLLDNIVKDLAR